MDARETFLIVEEQAVVQIDMAQSIAETSPGAQILQAQSPAHAKSLIDGTDQLTGAVVGVGGHVLKESGLAPMIAERGGWIICLNGRHGDLIRLEGWHPLARPFSSDDLQRMIRTLREDRPESRAAT